MLPDELKTELQDSLPPILNIPDICSILTVSDSTVRREIARAGGMPAYLVDGEWNIARADFLDYLSRHGTL